MNSVLGLGVVLLLLVASPASAWWFFDTSGRQEAEGPLRDDCIEKARKGDCNFYTCYEERHPCERNNFALDYGFRYCSRLNNHYNRLTTQAKRWVNNTRLCTMEKMIELYRREDNNCHDVEAEMKHGNTHCEVEHGVCSIGMLEDNKEVFSDVFDRSPQTAERFLRLIQHCGFERIQSIGEWMTDHSRPVFDFIRDIRDMFEDIVDDIDDGDRRDPPELS